MREMAAPPAAGPKVEACPGREGGCYSAMKRRALICAAVAVLVSPMFGCAAVPSQGSREIPAARPTPTPIPLRVLPQGVDDVIANHTAILLGPHDPKDVLDLVIAVDSARGGSTGGGAPAITAWARRVGFTVTEVTTNVYIGVRAPTARIERVLHLRINDYRLPGDYPFRANDRAPSVPVTLSILDIAGLSTYHRVSTGPAPLGPAPSPRPRSNARCGLCMLGGRMRSSHALVLARTPLST